MSGVVLPLPALVVLIGPSASGKTTWAREHFLPGEVVSSDRLREAVGTSDRDLAASGPAFEVLDLIVRHRLARGLTAVVDTLGLDPSFRASLMAKARKAGMAAVAVVFDTPAAVCRQRNRDRPVPVGTGPLNSQLRLHRQQRKVIESEGWDLVLPAGGVAAVSERPEDLRRVVDAGAAPDRVSRSFGLVLSSFPWPPSDIAGSLRDVAAAAADAGFDSLWVMDHLIQIPQVGRRWDAMLEGPTALAWLGGATERLQLGTLVANTSLRNPAHLAKIVATVDVLTGGRVKCGLGAGWWADEFEAYGMRLPPTTERLDRLEDCLELLPLMWGPGKTSFQGRTMEVRDAECYPRPIQARIPLIVGGQSPRTLRLAARYADGINLRGSPDSVRRSIGEFQGACAGVDRDTGSIEISHLSWPLVASDRQEVAALASRFRRAEAATRGEHAGRVEALSELGVSTFMFSPPDLSEGTAAVKRLASLVDPG